MALRNETRCDETVVAVRERMRIKRCRGEVGKSF